MKAGETDLRIRGFLYIFMEIKEIFLFICMVTLNRPIHNTRGCD